MIKKALFSAVIILLASCQTVGEIQHQATTKGSNPFSCEQIRSSFAAYSRDRQSLEALKTIAAMTNTSTKGLNTQTIDKYYTKVRDNANLALILQGCPPIQ